MLTNCIHFIYPDPGKPYFLFTDVPKYCWVATLCQCTSKSDTVDDLKPITFICRKFSDT